MKSITDTLEVSELQVRAADVRASLTAMPVS
jgi:hypothetical protein